MDQVFRSKIDAWLAVVVTIAIGSMWLAPVRRVWAGRPVDALDILAPVLATAFIVWIFTSTRYVITRDSLIVRAGPVRRTIPLQSIRRLRRTHNPLASPALSLDRIEVTYGSRRVLISPDDTRAFVDALRARTPSIVVEV